MMAFRNIVDQYVELAAVFREITRDLFTDEGIGQMGDLEAPGQCVMVGDGYDIHPPPFGDII
jgi:hypothetical protein